MKADPIDQSVDGLLRAADALMSPRDGDRAWPRGAAFLIRMALEQTLGEFWQREEPELAKCDMRAQLLCARERIDPETAERLALAWDALSEACHYHTYEIAPTAAELRRWHDEVVALTNGIAAKLPP